MSFVPKTPRLWQALSQSLEEHPLPCSGSTSPGRLTCLQTSHLWSDHLPHFPGEEAEALRGKQLVRVAQRGASLISWKQTISRDKQTPVPWPAESPVLSQEPRVGEAEATYRKDPWPVEWCPPAQPEAQISRGARQLSGGLQGEDPDRRSCPQTSQQLSIFNFETELRPRAPPAINEMSLREKNRSTGWSRGLLSRRPAVKGLLLHVRTFSQEKGGF